MPDLPVMLITGASKGIGQALARHYLEQGYRVVGCSRRPANWEAASLLHLCADVHDEMSVQRLFTSVRAQLGGLNVLINNAGIAAMNHMLLTPVQTAKRILDTNVIGTFLVSREAAKLLRLSQHARIVNFSTVA